MKGRRRQKKKIFFIELHSPSVEINYFLWLHYTQYMKDPWQLFWNIVGLLLFLLLFFLFLFFLFIVLFFHQEYVLMCCCCFFFFYKNSAKTTTIIIKIRIIFLCSFVGVVDGNNDVVDIDDNDAFNLKWGFFALSFFFLTTRNKKNR